MSSNHCSFSPRLPWKLLLISRFVQIVLLAASHLKIVNTSFQICKSTFGSDINDADIVSGLLLVRPLLIFSRFRTSDRYLGKILVFFSEKGYLMKSVSGDEVQQDCGSIQL